MTEPAGADRSPLVGGRPPALRLSGGSLRILALGGNRMAQAGLLGVVTVILLALLAPVLAPLDPLAPGDLSREVFLPPGPGHLLGTDQLGRDVWGRLLVGARVSLAIALSAVAVSVGTGVLLGAVAGYLGGWVDGLVMRIADVVLAVPRLVLLVAVIALLDPSAVAIVLLLAFTQWPAPARLIRAEILSLKRRDFVEAARALGFSGPRILFRHLIPNAVAPVLVVATLGVGHMVILEAGLSYLGLGVAHSWGAMLRDGQTFILSAWWLALFPGVAIALVAVSFNLLGDGVRDALDPRQGPGG
jgi:peptide/nickel transport system permease protein